MRIGLDGGHSYLKAGNRALDDSFRESEFNNFVVRLLGNKLEKEFDVSYSTTLSGPDDPTYTARKEKLNDYNCDFAISIHANAPNSLSDTNAQGILYLAKKSDSKSVELGRTLLNECIKVYPYKDTYTWQDGTTGQSLCNLNCPSVILELGFFTNAKDLVLIKSTQYRLDIVDSIYNGIKNYVKTFVSEKPIALYYEKEGNKVIECAKENLHIEYYKGERNIYVNGAFFNGVGMLFHSAVSDGKVVEKRKLYNFYPVGILKVLKNGSISIATQKVTDYTDIQFLVEGLNLDYEESGGKNLNESCLKEHHQVDILRKTFHTAIGYNYKTDRIYIVVTKEMVGDDARKFMRSLGCVNTQNNSECLLVDGGGSSKMVFNGEVKHPTNRLMNNIIYIE